MFDLKTFLEVRGLHARPEVLRAIERASEALSVPVNDLADGIADAAINEHVRLTEILGRPASVLIGALASDVPRR